MTTMTPIAQVFEDLPRRTAGVVQELATQLGVRYATGSKLPPVRSLSEDLGVATATAHRAVQVLVQSGLLIARPRQGTFVADELDQSSLQSLRGMTLGGGRSVLCGKAITFVQAFKEDYGHRRILADHLARHLASFGGTVGRVDAYSSDAVYTTHAADDVIVLIQPVGHQQVHAKPHQNVLVLTSGLEPAIHGTQRVDMVGVDQIHGGMLAGQALRDAGCKRICFIGRGQPPEFDTVDVLGQQRLSGLESAIGQAIPNHLRLLSYGYSPITGGVTFGKYLKLADRPDGVFAASDDVALGFIAAAVAHGLEMGRDYQLVGFDGQPSVHRLLPGGVASIELPLEAMAKAAADIIHKRMRQPETPASRLYLAGRFLPGLSVRC